mgnify:CR=1 FL=1
MLETDPYGNFLLQGYGLGTARDWLRLGLLYQQDGLWNGERLLPEGWSNFVAHAGAGMVRAGLRRHVLAQPDAQWPVPEDAYYMAGSGGQIT